MLSRNFVARRSLPFYRPMEPTLRALYNAEFIQGKYGSLLRAANQSEGWEADFRISETPIYSRASLPGKSREPRAGNWIGYWNHAPLQREASGLGRVLRRSLQGGAGGRWRMLLLRDPAGLHPSQPGAGTTGMAKGESILDYRWSSLTMGCAVPSRKRATWLAASEGLEVFGFPDATAGRRRTVERLERRALAEGNARAGERGDGCAQQPSAARMVLG